MKRPANLFLTLLITLVFSGTVIAAESSGDMPQATPGEMQSEGQIMTTPRASEIIGLEVKSNDGQELGEVDDLILSNDGNIEYLIISDGGLLGIDEKFVAIPWKGADVRLHEDTLLVGFSKEKFDNAPTFANWGEFEMYEQQVRAYYGEESGIELERQFPADVKPETEVEPGMRPGSESDVNKSPTETGKDSEY